MLQSLIVKNQIDIPGRQAYAEASNFMEDDMKTIKNAVDAADFIKNGRRGDRVMYHIGNLVIDRVEDNRLNQVATAMMRASDAGVVNLFQRRLMDNACTYIAVHNGKSMKMFADEYNMMMSAIHEHHGTNAGNTIVGISSVLHDYYKRGKLAVPVKTVARIREVFDGIGGRTDAT